MTLATLNSKPKHGPLGVRAGFIIEADGLLWHVIDIDGREAVCQLASGSRVIHRFRARAIEAIWRPVGARRKTSES